MTKSKKDTHSPKAPEENIPDELPILPLKGGVVYPNAVIPITGDTYNGWSRTIHQTD
jgi:hypothetical protein